MALENPKQTAADLKAVSAGGLATAGSPGEDARRAGLRYVTDTVPGIRRLRAGRSFRYVGPDGAKLRDEGVLARIRALAIPPAYEDVWICASARGHLQATGIDARGRKQYRYHPDWRRVRDVGKFSRMIEFGARLPALRRRVRRDLARPGLPREKVLAVVVALLEGTLIRIGNQAYARDNHSFGLTTLRQRHVSFLHDGRASFSFRGKGGLEHRVSLDDRRLARIVRRCHQLPGQQLFQYLDDAGHRQPVDSDRVNEYLGQVMGVGSDGEAFTAKDFRTWGGTLRAIAVLARTPLPEIAAGGIPSEASYRSCIVETIRKVATELRNTPAVCRKSYIHPSVFTAWRDGSLHRHVVIDGMHAPRRLERLALAFLRRQSRCARRATRGPSPP